MNRKKTRLTVNNNESEAIESHCYEEQLGDTLIHDYDVVEASL